MATEHCNVVYLLSRDLKLFAVARGGDGKILVEKNAFHHGTGDWTKPPAAEKLLTKDTEDKCQTFHLVDDGEQCVLEALAPGARVPEDTEPSSWADILRDLETNGMSDVTIFGHTFKRPEGAMTSDLADNFITTCTLTSRTH